MKASAKLVLFVAAVLLLLPEVLVGMVYWFRAAEAMFRAIAVSGHDAEFFAVVVTLLLGIGLLAGAWCIGIRLFEQMEKEGEK